MTRRKQVGLFAGSFNPITKGHIEVVIRAMHEFNLDKIIIGAAQNPEKPEVDIDKTIVLDSIDDYCHSVENLDLIPPTKRGINIADQEFVKKYRKNPKIVEIVKYKGLTVDYAISRCCSILIRGKRDSGADDAYEDNMAAMNAKLAEVRCFDLSTKFIETSNSYWSSSNARMYEKLGEFEAIKDICYPAAVEKMVEKFVARLINELKLEIDLPTMPLKGYHNNTHLACFYNKTQIVTGKKPSKDYATGIILHDACDTEQQVIEKYNLTGNIRNLVLATDHTGRSGEKPKWDDEARLFHDADISILASDRESYGWYAYLIHCEYAHFPLDEFISGRIAVLEGLLGSNGRFKHDAFKKFQKRADENMRREIEYWKARIK